MPRFDLGDADSESARPTATPPVRRLVVSWSQGGQQQSMILIAQAAVEAGRQSSRDLCLRLEPDSDQANYDKSMKISSHHFSLRYVGNGVQFVDVGSTNGTIMDGKRVEPVSPILIYRKTTVSLANALELELEPVPRLDSPAPTDDLLQAATANAADSAWLQRELIGADKPGMIGFLRINRTNNLPDKQYVLLFHSGSIGSDKDSLIGTLPSDMTPRRGRAFDLSDSSSSNPARLFVREGAIFIERTGSECVIVCGQSLAQGESTTLKAGEVVVGATTFALSHG